jgi:hypothetical protein
MDEGEVDGNYPEIHWSVITMQRVSIDKRTGTLSRFCNFFGCRRTLTWRGFAQTSRTIRLPSFNGTADAAQYVPYYWNWGGAT